MDQIENGWIVSAKAAEVPQRTFYRKDVEQAIAILKVLAENPEAEIKE